MKRDVLKIGIAILVFLSLFSSQCIAGTTVLTDNFGYHDGVGIAVILLIVSAFIMGFGLMFILLFSKFGIGSILFVVGTILLVFCVSELGLI